MEAQNALASIAADKGAGEKSSAICPEQLCV